MTQSVAGRKMKLGLILPNDEAAVNGQTLRFRELREMAQLAEQVGFDSLWMPDHLISRFPGEDEKGFWEAFTFLSGLAAVTSRIQLGPLVACTSFRNPALLARMADSIDEISNGRFILGLGAGGHEPEYRALAARWTRRFRGKILSSTRGGPASSWPLYIWSADLDWREPPAHAGTDRTLC